MDNLVHELGMDNPSIIDPIDSPTTMDVDPLPSTGKCKKSIVWTQFDPRPMKDEDGNEIRNEDGSLFMKAFCKICGEGLVYGGTNGTRHLKRHMGRCARKTSAEGGQPIIGRTATGSVYYFTFNQTVARQETIRYFVQEELPFNKIDKPAFIRWIKLAFGPQFVPPCRITMRKDVMKTFVEEKAAMKEILKNVPGKVCFTSDLWTSNQRLGYLCITAHFITSAWKLEKRIISFPMLPSPHTGKTISDAMYAKLLGWGLCGKIGTLTLDNASNNDSAVSQLRDSLFGYDMVDKEMFHLRCNAHIMNLLVKPGLTHFETCLENIRLSVTHVRTSQSKLQKFHEECQHMNMKEKTLPLDVPTRWDSTYDMLDAAIPYQKVFDLFFYQSGFKNIPSSIDWSNAIIIRDFLRVFKESTKLFSGSNHVTSSGVCYQLSKIALLLKKYAKVPGFLILHADMIGKYNKYWKDVPLLLGLASCMDPRYKLTTLDLCLDLNYDSEVVTVPSAKELKMAEFQKKMFDVFEEYQRNLNTNVVSQNEDTPSLSEDEDVVSRLLSQRREASILNCKSDLQRYLEQPTILANDKKFDLLEWWRMQEGMYPVLSAMARDLLTIPVSTVPSESAFSASQRVISKNRSCLLPETVKALMCLRDWFQAEEGLQNGGMMDMEELMAGKEL